MDSYQNVPEGRRLASFRKLLREQGLSMTIRLVFRCSRCGSNSFRRSSKLSFRDLILRKIGISPQRCRYCRCRFYLYRPVLLESLLKALADPPQQVNEGAAYPAKAKAAVASSVGWRTMAKADPREGRS